jgi:hypothetical protein
MGGGGGRNHEEKAGVKGDGHGNMRRLEVNSVCLEEEGGREGGAKMERNKDGGIIRRRKKVGKYWRREKEKLERKVEDAQRWKRRYETERLDIEDS